MPPHLQESGELPEEGRDWPKLMPWLLALVGVLCYVNTLPNAFVFDDTANVGGPRVRHLADLPTIFEGTRRPIVFLTLAINYAIDGTNPAGYHLFNLLIHVLAAVTLYGLARRTILRSRHADRLAWVAPWLAGAMALLWLVHPLNTQAVTYMIQRTESLMGLFYLLTLYCLLRYAETPARWGWAVATVAACAAGMGTKEVMVTAPIVALLYDRTFIAGSFAEAFKQRGKLYAGLAATWGLIWLMGLSELTSTDASAGFGGQLHSPLTYLLTQAGVIVHYLRLSVWPHPLVIDYLWPASDGVGDWLLPGLVILALLAGTAVGVWRNTWWGFLGAWFFLILGPTSSFLPIADPAMEHRMYLPLIAVVAGAVLVGWWGLRRLMPGESPRAVGGVLVLAVAAVLAGLTVVRNFEYRTGVGLWMTVIERRPLNPRGFHNLGKALQEENRIQDAVAAYEHELTMLPAESQLAIDAHNNLGVIWLEQGRLRKAVEHLQTAMELGPTDATVHYNFGRAMLLGGDLEKADQLLSRAIELNPNYATAYSNLATVRLRQQRLDEAEQMLRKAIELDPLLAEAYLNLGRLMLQQGRAKEAVELSEAALQFSKKPSASMLANLGDAYAATGQLMQAHGMYLRAAELNPQYVSVYPAMGEVMEKMGDAYGAAMAYAHALELSPDRIDVAIRLALILTTHPAEELRNGERAWSLLQPFAAQTDQIPALLDALAAAHAELGRLPEALAMQERAVQMAEAAAVPEERLNAMRDRLNGYRAGKPYRDPVWEKRGMSYADMPYMDRPYMDRPHD